mmetsp:Transcript_21715/g.28149  ORF Transcript_21715/g.28149 Transcript_21715/m.28149 type:complete len:528 (+) Transcript_21715:1-1584(+)
MRECIMKPGFVKVQWPVEDKKEKELYRQLSQQGCCHDRTTKDFKTQGRSQRSRKQNKRRVTFAYDKKWERDKALEQARNARKKTKKSANPVALDNLLRSSKHKTPVRQQRAPNGGTDSTIQAMSYPPKAQALSQYKPKKQGGKMKSAIQKEAKEKTKGINSRSKRKPKNAIQATQPRSSSKRSPQKPHEEGNWIQSRLQEQLNGIAQSKSSLSVQNNDGKAQKKWVSASSTALDTELDQLAASLFLKPGSQQNILSPPSSTLELSSSLDSSSSHSSLATSKLSEEISSTTSESLSKASSIAHLMNDVHGHGLQTFSAFRPVKSQEKPPQNESERYGIQNAPGVEEEVVKVNGASMSFSDLEAELRELEKVSSDSPVQQDILSANNWPNFQQPPKPNEQNKGNVSSITQGENEQLMKEWLASEDQSLVVQPSEFLLHPPAKTARSNDNDNVNDSQKAITSFLNQKKESSSGTHSSSNENLSQKEVTLSSNNGSLHNTTTETGNKAGNSRAVNVTDLDAIELLLAQDRI